MEVTLKIRNSKENANVCITGSMTFNGVKGLDEFITAVKLSRAWLAKQPAVPNA
jgi:hypothetical protein